jgi:hypothetical protein
MTHSNLRVEVQGTNIVVVLRGTCFRAKYRKQNAPWLATDEYGPDDLDAPMTLSEFRNAAWAAANDVALAAWMDQELRRITSGSKTGRIAIGRSYWDRMLELN